MSHRSGATTLYSSGYGSRESFRRGRDEGVSSYKRDESRDRDRDRDRDRARERERERDRGHDRDRDRGRADSRDFTDNNRARDREKDRDGGRDRDRDRIRTIPSGPGNDSNMGRTTRAPSTLSHDSGSMANPSTSSLRSDGGHPEEEVAKILRALGEVAEKRMALKLRKSTLEGQIQSRERIYSRTESMHTDFPSVSDLQKQHIHNYKRERDELDEKLKKTNETYDQMTRSLARSLVKAIPDIQTKESRPCDHSAESDKRFAPLEEQLARLGEERKMREAEVEKVKIENNELRSALASKNSEAHALGRDFEDLRGQLDAKSKEQDEEFRKLRSGMDDHAESIKTMEPFVKEHQELLTQVDIEAMDTMAEFLTFQRPYMDRSLKSLREDLDKLAPLPATVEEMKTIQTALYERVGGWSWTDGIRVRLDALEERSVAAAQPGAVSAQELGQLRSSIKGELDKRYDTLALTANQRFDSLENMVKVLDSQYNNLTSKSMYEQIVAHISPSLSRVDGDISQLQSNYAEFMKRLKALEERSGSFGQAIGDSHDAKRRKLAPLNGH